MKLTGPMIAWTRWERGHNWLLLHYTRWTTCRKWGHHAYPGVNYCLNCGKTLNTQE